ncbi:regulatory protein GemA [Rhodoblastus sp.]|uniref:regulatory protein GemA n=1 Tax=Rhodoblastus sp. TaxID=1962975 RepID=UPI003F966703
MTVSSEQIKAIHVLKGKAGLSDADYRDHLRCKFRVFSSKQLSEAQAGVLLDDLRQISGAAKAPARPAGKTASGKYAPILQALWLAAYHLGIVDERDDSALLSFVKRQTKVDHDRFLTDGVEAAKVIEALKAMLAREGGFAFATPTLAERFGVSLKTMNKRLVISALAGKIKASGLSGFDVESFACLEGFPPVARCDDAALDKLAAKMGALLRGRLGK